MQTFLPYPDFEACATVLDRQRLGKQRVEILQILRTLQGETSGWSRHPAVLMWQGHELALTVYGLTICTEWTARGYKDTCYNKILLAYGHDIDWQLRVDEMPWWWGVPDLHLSHQSALLRKFPAFYKKWFSRIPDDLDYWWPTHEVQVED